MNVSLKKLFQISYFDNIKFKAENSNNESSKMVNNIFKCYVFNTYVSNIIILC